MFIKYTKTQQMHHMCTETEPKYKSRDVLHAHDTGTKIQIARYNPAKKARNGCKKAPKF